MTENVVLSNDFLTVEIAPFGAELQRVTSKNGTEFLWHGDKAFWGGRSPILFPICGGLKDDKYIYEGREYHLAKHGFAKKTLFAVAKQDETYVDLVFTSDAETKEVYPFDFVFHAIFELKDNRLCVDYLVENTSDKIMYFSVGAHEGYACPEGYEEYSVLFDKEETLNSHIVNGNLLEYNTNCVLENGKVLPLKREYFEIDALVFTSFQSRTVTLAHNTSSKRITVSFPEFDNLLLWTHPDGKFLCIEPWCGIPDFVDSDYDFVNKPGILSVAPKGEKTLSHSILFEE